jgi:ABC-type nitrate/sulfonate/bicarbonate transport system substrate-binding protein
MKHLTLYVLASLIVMVGTASAQKSVSKFTVSYSSFNMPAAIIWIAKDDGLFAKYGLNEELVILILLN